MSILLASGFGGPFPFLHFVVGFIFLVCALAILIILCKWLLSLTGLTIPQPLLIVAGIVIFVLLFAGLLNWLGYSF